ncbi:carbonate dehydratase [Durotheca rogersii]|uniref:carbonate dehydratase n=1 Tax=Durotheca rogersii TaxID=419775 RepID=UPI00221E5CC9|nr:carbonate dehydratase [Durotheca rogersii]KAI5866345.1 carbonate dehydratase [Durotheca rogersii]
MPTPPQQDAFAYAMSSNQAWAGYKGHQNPEFFPKLATGQKPAILWLGCSDSRCPETTILGLQPGDVFVHRNIANIVSPTDINTSAVIEYAVTQLQVKHVVLCGHTSCGGAAATLAGGRVGGVLDLWLSPLRALRHAHEEELTALGGAGGDKTAATTRLAELNVEAGIRVLMANPVIQDAVAERGLQVHGTLFDIASGRIRDLGLGTNKGKGLRSGHSVGSDGEVVRGRYATLVFQTDGAAGMQVC